MNASLHVFNQRLLPSTGTPSNVRLRVGDHVVDLGSLRVVTNPGAARLTSKAAAVLIELAQHAGDTVTRDELLDRVWKDRVTTPDVLTQAIKELRRAFADDARPPSYIETIPKVGYRLLAPVSQIDAALLPVESNEFPPANDDVAAAEALALPAATQPARTMRRVYIATALAVAALVAAAILMRIASQPAAPPARWHAEDLRAVTSDPGPERLPRVSPDGTRIVYSKLDPDSGFERLIVRGVGPSQSLHPTRRAIAHEEMPNWSPDGTRIAFERLDKDEHCTMYVVPSMGGSDDEVGPCGDYLVNYFDWTPDGKNLITSDQQAGAAGRGLPLALLDLATGKKQTIDYARAPSDQDLDPHYSPDGRWIAFRRGLSPHSELFVMSAQGGAVRQVTHDDARIAGHAWTPQSDALVFSSNQDGAFALYTVMLADGREQALGVKPATFPTMSRSDARVVYEIQRTKTTLASVAVDGDGHGGDGLQLIARSTGSDTAPAVAPDGKQVVFVSDRNGSQQLWLYALDDSAEPLVLTDYRDAVIANPEWNDAGTRVLATVHQKGRTRLVEIELASRREHAVAASQTELLSGEYAAQPDSYLVVRRAADGHNELVLVDHADTAAERITPLAGAIEHMEFDRAAGLAYYTKFDEPGVFRRTFSGGAEQRVTGKVTANNMDGWRIVDGHIWYVSGMMQKPFELREIDADVGYDRVRARVNAWLRDVNFDVAPARDRVILAPMGPEDIDVGAFTLQRS